MGRVVLREYRRRLDVCAVGSLGVMGAKPLCKPPGGAGFCIAKTMLAKEEVHPDQAVRSVLDALILRPLISPSVWLVLSSKLLYKTSLQRGLFLSCFVYRINIQIV